MEVKIKYRLKIILVIFYMIFIYLFSEYKFPIPTGEGGTGGLNLFPFYHVCEFAILSLLLMFAFYDKNCIEFIISISVLYGIFDEFHQYFVPHRYFDIIDVFHDIVGSILGIVGFYMLLLIYYYLKFNRYLKIGYIDSVGYSWNE